MRLNTNSAYLTQEAERPETLAGLRDTGRIRVQTVNQETVAGTQGGRQWPVTAAEMDDKAAPDACRVKDLPGVLGHGGLGGFGTLHQESCQRHNRYEPSATRSYANHSVSPLLDVRVPRARGQPSVGL